MPRKPAHTTQHLVDAALKQFWANGFSATSMDDLVRATGASRHALYKTFDGKEALFAAIFARYDAEIVTPAVARVETDGAGLDAIAAYLDHQIALAESTGLPGPGCLVGNTQSEPAAQSPAVRDAIAAHRTRLSTAFARAIAQDAPHLAASDIEDLARFTLTAVQGLWSSSRVTTDVSQLRRTAGTLIALLKLRTGHA